ncbi:ABC transporter permease subunit [bacterium]|nr:ABC transporter permease subunit [bacterium]
MGSYLARRLLTSLAVLLGASMLTFSILHLVPGDPVAAMLGRQAVSGERAAELRAQLGLDDPLPVQYARYLGAALRGDLGMSIRSDQPVTVMIGGQLPSTLQLAAAALTIALLLGFVAGIAAAFWRNSWIDSAVTLLAVGSISIPSFWLGMLLIFVFSVQLGWLPSSSSRGDWRGLILPALTLGVAQAGVIARIVRASLVEQFGRLYVVLARAKGLREHIVVMRHALPNALIPVVTLLGLQVGFLLVGAIVVETVFARQGLGRLAVTAINNRDYPLVQGIVLVTATAYVLINTLTDLAYAWLDPRIRLQ